MKACINGIYSSCLLCKGSLAIDRVKVEGRCVSETMLAEPLKITQIQRRQIIFFAIFGWEEGRGLKNVNIQMPFFLQNDLLLMMIFS